MRLCVHCGNEIKRPDTSRSKKWAEIARFCSRACHYAHGGPRRQVEERFWEKVERRGPNDCWPWLSAVGVQGYGRFTAETGRTVIASRFAYELVNGPIADRKIMVRHTCDNPVCCNPAHLELGSAFDNEHDKIDRGRNRKAVGERAPTAKLTTDDVREIRRAWDAREASQSALARRFGVRSGTVSLIVRRLTWRHV